MLYFTGLNDIFVLFPEFDDVARPTVPPVLTFTTYCRSVKPQDDFADAKAFTPKKLNRWLEYVVFVDYLNDIDEFRYRYYGAGIVDFTGFDMTGRLVSDFDSEVGRFFDRLYRKCLGEKMMIYSEHNRVHAQRDCNWHRVLCPVQDGDHTFVVACNYPIPKEAENAGAIDQRRAIC